jgi:methylated-DNA-[protein]-cysteine S-methyltransferase
MAEKLRLLIDRVATPIGELTIVADERGRLRAVEFADNDAALQRDLRRHGGGRGGAGVALAARRDPFGFATALRAYFAGDLRAIDGLPVETGGTDFQRRVWRELRKIPCGRTISYAALARRAGRPAAMRAAGHANGSNPITIVLPCHRVVGTDGALTGYGGGIARKRWLLEHEGAALAK